MTTEEFDALISKCDFIPSENIGYAHTNGTVKPPFLVWMESNTDQEIADNQIWETNRTVTIELYSRLDPFVYCRKLEDWLDEQGLLWERANPDTWIDTDKIYESVYTVYL